MIRQTKAKFRIREAVQTDSQAIANLMMQAMAEVVSKLTGAEDPYSELPFLERFIRLPENQYSYQNTLVFEDEQGVCGSLTAYDGAKLYELRQPILDYLNSRGIVTTKIDSETGPGEFYIDTIGVSPEKQGYGLGTQLLEAGIKRGTALGHRRIGLLVNPENSKAKKFYERMGFREQGIRHFLNIAYSHMVFKTSEGAEQQQTD
ncbi:GNAT family N-acetyltransferase [Arcticibacter sp.]|uniref:GNAT family N-acetyltransferase n=1 Tax=Arcticibacter sp. TaxID=1872630 RepID=UPI00388D9B12